MIKIKIEMLASLNKKYKFIKYKKLELKKYE